MSTVRLSSYESPADKLRGSGGALNPGAVLLSAASRVAEEWTRWTAGDPDAAELADLGPRMMDAIRECSEKQVPVVDPRLRSPAGRRLLQMLRNGLVNSWSERGAGASPREMIGCMSLLVKLDEAVDPPSLVQALAPLAGPDGPELVVEVAHDLRSPVTAILFLAETLQSGRSGEVNDLQRRQMGLIYAAGLGLSTVASDLIELAQGGDRLTERKPAPFSLSETLEAVRDITRPIAEEKQLSVSVKSALPDYRLGFPMVVSRVLLNLTTNALKFTERGSVDVEAKATVWGKVEFSVTDTGPGIQPEALDNLYRPFRHERGSRQLHFSGTGLGLTICRRLVNAMGSELRVETSAGNGTRFFFEIDLAPAGSL